MPIIKKKKLEFKADLAELARARDAVKEFVGDVFSPVEFNRVVLAVDEALANVVEHAYKPGSDETFTLEMQEKADCFIFILEDNAEVFDPTRLEAPDLDEHARAVRDGGLGVFLYTTLLEATHAALPGGGNRLTLVKRIS